MASGLGLATPSVYAAFSVALGLAALGVAAGPWTMALAWLVIGLAMGAGLYEAAFGTLVRLYGSASRDAITGITLIAGFASTVGWPLSAWMNEAWGWRGACFGWAVLHLLLGLPLHLWPAPSTPTARAVT